MKRNDNYILTKFNDCFFLVPTGQAAANLQPLRTINEVGAFIWEALEKDIPIEHLIKMAMSKYATSPEDIAVLTDDIYTFVNALKVKGLIIDNSIAAPPEICNDFTIKIAGIVFNLQLPRDIIHPCFNPFSYDTTAAADVNVVLKIGLPKNPANGNVLLRNGEVIVMKTDCEYILLISAFERIKEIHISLDLKEVVLFALTPYDDKLSEEIYLGLRTPFLLNALSKGMIMLHSASLVYKNKLYCFSGPSGMGKSTHTKLWTSLFGVELINGDLNLLAYGDENTYVYGTPWCGTSGIFSTEAFLLGGIVFLEKSPSDNAVVLSEEEAYPRLVSRITSPCFERSMTEKILSQCQAIVKTAPMLHLKCTPEASAVYAVKQKIDSFE